MKQILYIFIIILIQSCSIMIPLKDLPKPDGEFIVGTDIMILEDTNRLEYFTEDENDFRKIILQVWYPAIAKNDSIYPYLDYQHVRIPYIANRLGVSEKIIEHISGVKANSYYKARHVNKEFPIIIFSHGLGGNRTQNTANIESLASNGYIVYAIEHTFDANITVFNDSTSYPFKSYLHADVDKEEFYNVRIPQIITRAKDISFLIDQITLFKSQGLYLGRISDINSIGVFGHSFGGGTAALSSYLDSRIDACLGLDAWFEPMPPTIINSGINIPFCWIGQIQKDWTTAPYNEQQLLAFHENNKNDSYIIEIEDTKHMDYADIPYITRVSRLMGLSGKAGKNITLDLSETINLFFDNYLKNENNLWMKTLEENYNIIKQEK